MSDQVDQVAELWANLKHLDSALSVAEPTAVASLLRERRITLAAIADLEGVEKGSTVDQLASRRAHRRATAGVESPAV